jgi:hypothetical protein
VSWYSPVPWWVWSSVFATLTLSGFFVFMWVYMKAWAVLRNCASFSVQNGRPVEWIGGVPVYEWAPPNWVGRLLGPHNIRGMMVSRNDGFILMHGDRLQPAAMLLHSDLRRWPELRLRQIEHEIGHTRIAVAGGPWQVQRNVWYDFVDSYRTNAFARRIKRAARRAVS